jgi:hypothetical protein
LGDSPFYCQVRALLIQAMGISMDIIIRGLQKASGLFDLHCICREKQREY